MNSFRHLVARTPESAVDSVRDRGRFIAGGTDLLGELKDHIAEPDLLVDIRRLPGTAAITSRADRWSVGSNVRLAELAAHDGIRRNFPALAEAAGTVASPQIRNVATVGGNLAQHSRCWYYRHPDIHCLKKGGRRCYARDGENKYHCLFTNATCISPLLSNLAVALTALGATAVVQRGPTQETLTLAQLYASAWESSRPHNSLHPGDLILRIELPASPNYRSTYLQLAEKRGFDWALVSCAAAAKVDGRTLHEVHIVLGAVAPVPWEVAAANAALEGAEPTESNADRAAELILQSAEPLAHNAYKLPQARALVRRALARLIA